MDKMSKEEHWYEGCKICDAGFCQAFDTLLNEKRLKQTQAARALHQEAILYAKEQYKIDEETASKIVPSENAFRQKYLYLAGLKENANSVQSEQKSKSVFNSNDEGIEWAKWSWNPVTGCKHGCPYCYARDIANRFYPDEIGFEPHFYKERLEAPQNSKIPKSRKDEKGIHNVFVCSMADLFGDWVPNKWIKDIFKIVENSLEWNFLFLTKNPKRYLEIPSWPTNCAIGATADTQERANVACDVFEKMDEDIIKFLSCEPLEEKIILPDGYFQWLIIGGRSKTSGMPAAQPEWEWVASLITQARRYGICVYWKPNLSVRPKEYPTELR
jgi:protein gp37